MIQSVFRLATRISDPPPMPDPLLIGSLLFPDMDQADFTGPFEVLSRIPDSRLITLAKSAGSPRPLRDFRGLILTPETALSNCPPLDILHLPGGPGQQALMEDAEVLAFIRTQAKQARYIFCVCTGALIAGAAGLLKGRRATSFFAIKDDVVNAGAHWEDAEVVVDGNLVTSRKPDDLPAFCRAAIAVVGAPVAV